MAQGTGSSARLFPVDWLLAGEPHVRYRTLVDLLGRPETDDEVLAAKRAIPRHKLIRGIFARQNQEGYWGSARDIQAWWPRKDTTFWVLGVLADFGLRRSARRIAVACENVLGMQHPSGGFGWAPPPTPAECFTGITGVGQRVYSFAVQGQKPEKDFDIFKEAGGPYKAIRREYEGVEVTDGKLRITFTPNIENPAINGIEIFAE